jgi:diguanylate cyclase (GGDEF)-like protein
MAETIPAESEIQRLKNRLARERRARLEAETIAETGLRALYEKQLEMELLERVAGAANQTSSIPEALQVALDQLGAYTGWPLGFAYVAEDDVSHRRMVRLAVRHVSRPGVFERFYGDDAQSSYEWGVGLPGRVAAARAPVWIGDLSEDPKFIRANLASETGLRSGFAFPVMVGDDVAAVLEFFSDTSSDINESLLRVVSHVGTHLARVVERSRAVGLEHHAYHDALTKLPNRALFLDRLRRAVSRSIRHPEYNFAVLFVDLDGFKTVNDSLGHAAGDRLIVEIAERLRQSLRRDTVGQASAGATGERRAIGDDTVARLGGDEFTILVDEVHDPSDAVRVAERIQKQLAPPFDLNGQEIFTTASIGIVASGPVQRTAEEFIRDADTAMYRAKALGKARYEIFDQVMHQHAVSRLKLETDLRRALERNEFKLHYQPIVTLTDLRIVGCEALLRWQRPGAGLLLPAEFIDVAEETSIMVPLGRWVLREVCRQVREWHTTLAAFTTFSAGVNISPRQFAQPDLVAYVRETLMAAGLSSRNLKLELTERVAMQDVDRASATLSQLSDIGVQGSLDAFGTGYSSLSRLRHIPVSALKIDRSFTRNVHEDRASRAIVMTIVTLAHSLGMQAVAEGLETDAHVRELRALGCDLGQGNFFSPPVDGRAFEKLLTSG